MPPASAARASLLLSLALACSGNGPATPDTAATDDTASTSAAATTDAAATTTTAPTTGDPPGPLTTTTDDPSTTSTSPPATTGDLTADPSTGDSSSGDTTAPADTTTADTTTSDTSAETTSGDTTSVDTTTADTTSADTASDTTTGAPDGFGVISGDCGLIDAMELNSPMAYVFTGAIDFGMTGFDYDLLTPGGQQMFDEGNLNAGSLESEIVAYEVLARCDMAKLLKTEGTIVYMNPMGKKTDILVEMDGLKVGVSVVRAVGFPQDDPYTVQQATTILNKKLSDILVSSQNVAPEDAWVKQILSVVAYAPGHVDSLLTAYAALDPAVKADTILVITATNGNDIFIYD